MSPSVLLFFGKRDFIMDDTLLELKLDNKLDVARCYIPQFSSGGMFISRPPEKIQSLSFKDQVFLRIDMDGDSFPVTGRIMWINRHHSKTRPSGIGICFDSDQRNCRSIFESICSEVRDNTVVDSYTF